MKLTVIEDSPHSIAWTHAEQVATSRGSAITASEHFKESLETAAVLLGQSLELPLGPGEPPSGTEFRRLATEHTFGDSWPRSGLDVRSKALISVAIAATLGTHEPLRGQLRIALNSGVSKEEVVELFIHLEAYAGAARAFHAYQIVLAVFAESIASD
jgi:alkylhydroperoxidase/carboxymuconolactone decarboxylase family protein YurZ